VRRFRPRKCLFWLSVVTTASIVSTGQGCASKIEREALVEDSRYIASVLEEVHPDPYVMGGGRVAFHRRQHEVIRGIPPGGMTKADFYFHLRPFVTAVGDAHTWLNGPEMTFWSMPGGVPLFLWVVERSLYVRGVFNDEDMGLIGCRLAAIEGIPYEEIVSRAERVISHDNYYQVLRNLAAYGQIFQGVYLKKLLPEWTSEQSITVTLEHPDGSRLDHTFKVPTPVGYPPKYAETSLEMPSTGKCDFVYEFIGDDRKTALLVISGMMRYRETLEMWRSFGGTDIEERVKDAYKRFHGSDPPKDLDLAIEGVPSATEVFRELVKEMKEAGTENLVIDIRENEGGNSYMAPILIYFLYGRDGLAGTIEAGSEVIRYSQAYLDRYTEVDLSELNREREVPIVVGGYDFEFDFEIFGEPPVERKFENFDKMVARMPTFEAEYEKGTYGGWYRPEKVLVVSSHNTFSSGFTLLRYLYMAGAEMVGTPSAQAANCFGDILNFELPHSGLTFSVSRKVFVFFPDDPERGKVLMPQHLLTYEKLRELRFDRNAAVLYALEVARR
jgi:hypothetical protein